MKSHVKARTIRAVIPALVAGGLLLPFNAGAQTYPAWTFVNATGVVTHFNEARQST